MQEKLKDHTVPNFKKEHPIQKWMVSKGDGCIIVQDDKEKKIKDKDYLEGFVSINELCINHDGNLALSSDPFLKPAEVAGIAIFGYTG